jgi:ABC-2 type transport system ATP-binding protein
MTSQTPVLEVRELVKRFSASGSPAVDGISFTLHEGEILGLLGPNGAGKTTTIQMLLSTLLPTKGSIQYFGKELATHRSEILSTVSFASTYLKLPGSSTIEESLSIYGMLYGVHADTLKNAIKENLEFFGMWDLRGRRIYSLSAGQMTRVMLAKAFLSNPRVVLLDEPTASLDPDIAHEVRAFVKAKQRQHGTSMIFTSHNMAEVEEVCDRVLVLKGGQIIASQTPEALAASVAFARVELVSEHAVQIEKYALDRKLVYVRDGFRIDVEIDEKHIAAMLADLARTEIGYTQISIAKPTLEDYFIQMARQKAAS